MKLDPMRPKDGVAVAAIFSAALGCAVIGIATILVEMNPAIKTALTWCALAGPLSGKTGIGVLVWLISWPFFHAMLKNREIDFDRSWKRSLVLIIIGLLGTFPPIFKLFSFD